MFGCNFIYLFASNLKNNCKINKRKKTYLNWVNNSKIKKKTLNTTVLATPKKSIFFVATA